MHAYQIFSKNPLDRGERQRRNETWITETAKRKESKYLVLCQLQVLISAKPESNLVWLNYNDLSQFDIEEHIIFLGLMGRTAYYSVDISSFGNAVEKLQLNREWIFQDVRSAAELISIEGAGMLAQAVAQTNWHDRHKCCAVCGQKTEVRRGGQVRQCRSCETQHFPRTDPVTITVVSHQDHCLLGQSRGRMSRGNIYSALAGFVDQGESIEEAAAREIMEEAGIKVSSIRYLFSQPWPFPYSLMIGCHAKALTTKIVKDEQEMTDVRWFSRSEVQLALEGKSRKLQIPGPIAIAHHLIKAWAIDEH